MFQPPCSRQWLAGAKIQTTCGFIFQWRSGHLLKQSWRLSFSDLILMMIFLCLAGIPGLLEWPPWPAVQSRCSNTIWEYWDYFWIQQVCFWFISSFKWVMWYIYHAFSLDQRGRALEITKNNLNSTSWIGYCYHSYNSTEGFAAILLQITFRSLIMIISQLYPPDYDHIPRNDHIPDHIDHIAITWSSTSSNHMNFFDPHTHSEHPEHPHLLSSWSGTLHNPYAVDIQFIHGFPGQILIFISSPHDHFHWHWQWKKANQTPCKSISRVHYFKSTLLIQSTVLPIVNSLIIYMDQLILVWPIAFQTVGFDLIVAVVTFCTDLHVLILSLETYIFLDPYGWTCLLNFIFYYIMSIFWLLVWPDFSDQFNPICFLISSKLVEQLDDCSLDTVRISDCFIRNSLGFTIYSDYCTNYPRFVYISMITFHFQTKHPSGLWELPDGIVNSFWTSFWWNEILVKHSKLENHRRLEAVWKKRVEVFTMLDKLGFIYPWSAVTRSTCKLINQSVLEIFEYNFLFERLIFYYFDHLNLVSISCTSFTHSIFPGIKTLFYVWPIFHADRFPCAFGDVIEVCHLLWPTLEPWNPGILFPPKYITQIPRVILLNHFELILKFANCVRIIFLIKNWIFFQGLLKFWRGAWRTRSCRTFWNVSKCCWTTACHLDRTYWSPFKGSSSTIWCSRWEYLNLYSKSKLNLFSRHSDMRDIQILKLIKRKRTLTESDRLFASLSHCSKISIKIERYLV